MAAKVVSDAASAASKGVSAMSGAVSSGVSRYNDSKEDRALKAREKQGDIRDLLIVPLSKLVLLAVAGYDREAEQVCEEVGAEVIKAGTKRMCLDGIEAIGLGLEEEVKERSEEVNVKGLEPGCLCGFRSTKNYFKSSSKNKSDRPELVKSLALSIILLANHEGGIPLIKEYLDDIIKRLFDWAVTLVNGIPSLIKYSENLPIEKELEEQRLLKDTAAVVHFLSKSIAVESKKAIKARDKERAEAARLVKLEEERLAKREAEKAKELPDKA